MIRETRLSVYTGGRVSTLRPWQHPFYSGQWQLSRGRCRMLEQLQGSSWSRSKGCPQLLLLSLALDLRHALPRSKLHQGLMPLRPRTTASRAYFDAAGKLAHRKPQRFDSNISCRSRSISDWTKPPFVNRLHELSISASASNRLTPESSRCILKKIVGITMTFYFRSSSTMSSLDEIFALFDPFAEQYRTDLCFRFSTRRFMRCGMRRLESAVSVYRMREWAGQSL